MSPSRPRAGQVLPLLVAGLVSVLLVALLLGATSRTHDRAAEAQAAADEASRAAALVAADTLAAIAHLNAGVAYLDHHLARYVTDRAVYDTLYEFKLHPPVPAPDRYVGTEGIERRSALARGRAASWVPRGERWMDELWRAARALAESAPRRMREAAERAAARHGGTVVAYEAPARWLPSAGAGAVLADESWERFGRIQRSRYTAPGDVVRPPWYDLAAGAPRGYGQLRECWHELDCAHDRPPHGAYWPNRAFPSGHWHLLHLHYVITPLGPIYYVHEDGHTDDGHPPADDQPLVHHAIFPCPTCAARDRDGDGATDVRKTLADVVARHGRSGLAVRRPRAGAPPALVLGPGGPPEVQVTVHLPVRQLFRPFAPRREWFHARSRAAVGLFARDGSGHGRVELARPRGAEWLAGDDNLYATRWGARWVPGGER